MIGAGFIAAIGELQPRTLSTLRNGTLRTDGGILSQVFLSVFSVPFLSVLSVRGSVRRPVARPALDHSMLERLGPVSRPTMGLCRAASSTWSGPHA